MILTAFLGLMTAGAVVLSWVVFLVGTHHGYNGPFMGTATHIAALSLIALVIGGGFGLGSLFDSKR